MKIIDKNGKLFEKIHIFDFIIGLLVLTVILGAVNKFSNNAIVKIAGGSEQVKATFWFESLEYPEMSFECVKVGDQISENKRYLDGEVKGVTVIDFEEGMVDDQGKMVVGINPLFKKVVIQAEATLDKKGLIYKLGNQEIREGQMFFLTTDTVSYSGYITKYEIHQ